MFKIDVGLGQHQSSESIAVYSVFIHSFSTYQYIISFYYLVKEIYKYSSYVNSVTSCVVLGDNSVK